MKWTKNRKDSIGNRTCDLPACSTVPQPTALWPTILLPGSNGHYSSITVFFAEHTSKSSTLLRFWPLEDLVRLKNKTISSTRHFQFKIKQFLAPDQTHSVSICLDHIRNTHERLYTCTCRCRVSQLLSMGCGASSHELSNAGGIAGLPCLRRS